MKLRFALCVAGALLGACGDNAGQVSGNGEDSNQVVSNIIGGFDAKSASLNAVGTIGTLDEKGQYAFTCSATLIGKQTVLTAKQCAMVTNSNSPLYKMKLVNLIPMYFAVGPDANSPVKVVEIIAADLSPVEEGGFNYIGNDVAVLHLIAPVEGVTPIKVAELSLTEKDIDQPFVSIGFGVKDNFEALSGIITATRSAGKNTLRALEGGTFELMLGTFEAFIKQMVGIYGQDIVDENMDVFQSWWSEKLLSGYEAWVGFSPGDVQTCNGDSGSPLIGRELGVKAIFGVASANWFSTQKTCDYGTFYATIGVETHKMLAVSAKYVDPCKGGITVKGSCDRDVATRCTGKWEGDRTLSQMDCSLLDQVCAVDASGRAGCVDEKDAAGGVVIFETPAHPAAPTVSELRKSLQANTKLKQKWAASQK